MARNSGFLKEDEVVIEKVPKSVYGKIFYITKYYDDNKNFQEISEPQLNDAIETAKVVKKKFNKKRIRKTF